MARLISGTAFGELGIIADDPKKRVRTASVITTKRCIFATLTRDSYVFVTEIAKMKPLIDKFWKLADGDDAWEPDAEIPLFISFAQFRRLELRVNRVFNAPITDDKMMMSSDADDSMEQAVLTKWKSLVGEEGSDAEAQSQVLGYNKFVSSFFRRYYEFLGGIEVALLYRQCLALTLDTIATKKVNLADGAPAAGADDREVLVFKKLGEVGSQRAVRLLLLLDL